MIVTSPEKKTYNYFLLELSSLEVCGVTHNTGLKTKKITVRWVKNNERVGKGLENYFKDRSNPIL